MRIELATNDEIAILHAKYKKFNIQHLEVPTKFYPYIGIIDVYNRVLTEQEALDLLSSYESHNLKYGSRFLTAITQIYNTDDEVFVHIHKNQLDKKQLKFILSSLNRLQSNVFRKMFSTKKGIYKIGDVEALQFLVKLAVEELFFSNFFFTSLETVIISNYELSFPLYSKTAIGFKKCQEIIEKNGIFIR